MPADEFSGAGGGGYLEPTPVGGKGPRENSPRTAERGALVAVLREPPKAHVPHPVPTPCPVITLLLWIPRD